MREMDEPVWNNNSTQPERAHVPATYAGIPPAFLFVGSLILLLIFAASFYFLQRPFVFIISLGVCTVLVGLLARQSLKFQSEHEQYTALLEKKKELEILASALVQAHEDERKRIAREIHDGLGQMLTAIKFNVEILEDMIPIGKDERERIDDMKNLLDSVMKEAREISYDLMPSVLDDFGLPPALQLLSEQFSSRTNVKVQFHSHGVADRFDPKMEIGLYRIAQESLNNVWRHAEATEVDLQIIRHSDGIRLVVEDNGKGIAPRTDSVPGSATRGIGLAGMRERATSIGGVLTVDSTPDHGTLITVELPLVKSQTHE